MKLKLPTTHVRHEKFSQLRIEHNWERLNKWLAELPDDETLGQDLSRIHRLSGSIASARNSGEIDAIKESAKRLVETDKALRRILNDQAAFSKSLADIESKLTNDLRSDLHAREERFKAEYKHTSKTKRQELFFSVLQRSITTASVIAIVAAMLWFLVTLNAPIPRILAPIYAAPNQQCEDNVSRSGTDLLPFPLIRDIR